MSANQASGAVDIEPVDKGASTRQLRKRAATREMNGDTVPLPLKANSKPRKAVDVESEFETVWICSLCQEAECLIDQNAEQLLVCEGNCKRLFHYPCAGLKELPPTEESYVCADCISYRHLCCICQEFGKDDMDVFKCQKDSCGLFFHESCLSMQSVDVELLVDSATKNVTRRFVCPAHSCWSCAQSDIREPLSDIEKNGETNGGKHSGKKAKRLKAISVFQSKTERFLYRCLICPTSFHLSCIPPGAKYHELAVLCPIHAFSHKLPELDPEGSVQKEIENAMASKNANFERKLFRQSIGTNPFFVGLKGTIKTKAEQDLAENLAKISDVELNMHFCLPCDLSDEVHATPSSFRHVNSLQYDPARKPPRIPPSDESCHCIDRCDESCLNRITYVECFGDATQARDKKKYANCNVGIHCGNRSLGQRKFVKCKPKREHGRGWGLVTTENVTKGSLVYEYVGEVVDASTKEKRLIEWTRDHPNDPNFYLMALGSPGWFIDAREVANLSRFINHSCDPNCVLLPINVAGYMRCGIFALKDIKAGDFLSYDYQFQTRQGDKFVCRCGSSNCRGTMMYSNINGGEDADEKKDKNNIWEDAKARYERDKRFLEEFKKSEEERCSQVRSFVPNADSHDELVSNGPQDRYRITAIANRIFLWRNAVRGSDFHSRFERLAKK